MSARDITPELLLNAYASGVFPMADSRDDEDLFWVDPNERGVLPLEHFHSPRSLKKLVRQDRFEVTVNQSFRDVVNQCAAPARGRNNTWISEQIEDVYTDLHRFGFAHSIECRSGGKLVGGLYGVCLAGAFFGESMFHTETGASKVALVHLVARLIDGGFTLLDTQFGTEHLAQFGVIEIPRTEYHKRLEAALSLEKADFHRLEVGLSGDAILQSITQTS